MEIISILVGWALTIGGFIVSIKIHFNDLKHLEEEVHGKNGDGGMRKDINNIGEKLNTLIVDIATLKQQVKDKLNGNK